MEAGKGRGGGEVTPGENAASSENSGKTAFPCSLQRQRKPTLAFSSFPSGFLSTYCVPSPGQGLGTWQGAKPNDVAALMKVTFSWGQDQPRPTPSGAGAPGPGGGRVGGARLGGGGGTGGGGGGGGLQASWRSRFWGAGQPLTHVAHQPASLPPLPDPCLLCVPHPCPLCSLQV